MGGVLSILMSSDLMAGINLIVVGRKSPYFSGGWKADSVEE